MNRCTPITALFLALLPVAALAADPPAVLLAHSGRLLGTNEAPVTSPVTITVKLWDGTDERAAEKWHESYDVKPNSQGVYTVVIGDTVGGKRALTADDFGSQRFLSVTIATAELLPRMIIGSVPLAGRAHSADAIGGLTITDLDARYAAKAGANGYVQVDPSSPQAGAISVVGDVTTGGKFKGDGSALTKLDASQITPGTVTGKFSFSNAENAFNGVHTGSGTGLTGLDPAQISAGTIGSKLALTNIENTYAGTFTGNHVGDGSALSNLDAAKITAGTIPATAIPAEITKALTLSNTGNVFTGKFNGSMTLASSSSEPFACVTGASGAVYFDTTSKTLSYCNGSAWSKVGQRSTVLRWFPPTLDLGTTSTTATTATANLTNFGDDPVTSVVITAPTGFTASPVGCSPLAGGATCVVTFGFASGVAPGIKTATATVQHAGGAGPSLDLRANLLQPKSCKELLALIPSTQSGVYTIDPDGAGSIPAVRTYCDMSTDNGGWTLIEMAATDLDLNATYWSPAERNITALADFVNSPNTSARLSAEAINAVCKSGDGLVRHRYANNAPGYMLTDKFDASILQNLDIARMLRGDSNFHMGFSNFGNNTLTASATSQWKRYNSYLTDNLLCTSIHSYCGGSGTAYAGWGPLCDSYGCNKGGQRGVDGNMWWAGTNAPKGVPGPTAGQYANYGSRWCR